MAGALLLICTVLPEGFAYAHPVLSSAPSDDSANTASVAAGIVLAAGAYAAGLRRVWQRSGGRGRRELVLHASAFLGGLAALALALLSPLDHWAAELFAIHMVQHEILMLIAAPLLVVGRPLPLFLWAFAKRSRASVAEIVHARPVQAAWTVLLSPLFAWLLHALVLWLWHAPALFDAALRNETVHEVQHLSFLVSALVFWAAMIESRKQEQQGAAMLYLFTTTIHTSVLGALITFARTPWYAPYLQTPRDWGVTALEDQQVGGLIMWVPGSLVYIGVAMAVFVRWIRASDAHAHHRYPTAANVDAEAKALAEPRDPDCHSSAG